MRPSVEEQLQGTCRILETVVAPAVVEPYARTILDNLIANLRMVTVALPKVSMFLRNDNDATLSLLLTLRDALPPELVTRIDRASLADRAEVAEESAVEEHNILLRALLAEAVCHGDLVADMRTLIENHMVDRASRVPMRYVPTVTPATPSTTER